MSAVDRSAVVPSEPTQAQVLPTASGRASLRALARAAGAHRGLVLTSLLTAVVASVATTATPVLLGRVVDAVVDLRAAGDQVISSQLMGLFFAIAASVLIVARGTWPEGSTWRERIAHLRQSARPQRREDSSPADPA